MERRLFYTWRTLCVRMCIVCLMVMPGVAPAAQTPGAPGEPIPIISPGPEDMALTIYRDSLAFVTETRTVTLPAGRSTVSFEGVSDLMIPQTALLREFGAVTIERNFDFDLLSQGSLMQAHVGKEISLVRTNPVSGKSETVIGTLISARRGAVINIDGEIEVFDCSGLPEKIVFDQVPENLIDQPTLSLVVTSETAGPQTFTISYLASGFDWQADYLLTLGEDEGKAALAGWLTVTNGTNQTVRKAPTAIIAGDLQRLYETRADRKNASAFFAACWPQGSTSVGTERTARRSKRFADRRAEPGLLAVQAFSPNEGAEDEITVAGARQATREDLGDYKLFRTPEPTTVAAYQTKQVAFLDNDKIGIERFHVFDFDLDNLTDTYDRAAQTQPASLRYDIDNSATGDLAQPLPAGTVRVFMPGEDDQFFYLGEDNVRDLAVDLPVEITIAESPSVSGQTIVSALTTKDLKDGRTQYRARVDHQLFNSLGETIRAELTLNRNGYVDAPTVSRASRRQVRNSPYPKWRFDVAPGSTASLAYTVSWVD
ncbi:MAG: hypothetical protein AAFY83_05235 [Pseudomonadota bacterium]